ncbi:uncharacterized protein LOC107864767 isoform X2 [Capsicum annuum]|uniref:uncharacterized protein LOC107864767 isoform X2 n=1 Tax=Capsicum annuum TaxID=4072 RepID=UPI001FB163C1|nr:uncharacterized protein LOC107864767 isoform X2 [Capsicum annuum]
MLIANSYPRNRSFPTQCEARLASLGLHQIMGDLQTKSKFLKKTNTDKLNYFSAPLSRPNRLQNNSAAPAKNGDVEDDIREKPANVPLLSLKDGPTVNLSPEALSQRCTRLKVAVACHVCREKKFCGEKECKRCGELDMDQPCLGMTDCSICHSSNGVLCRGCLKNRYGEEMEDVRSNKEWICPHCTEEKGINPYWICSSSLCLKKRKMAPTGLDYIFRVLYVCH